RESATALVFGTGVSEFEPGRSDVDAERAIELGRDMEAPFEAESAEAAAAVAVAAPESGAEAGAEVEAEAESEFEQLNVSPPDVLPAAVSRTVLNRESLAVDVSPRFPSRSSVGDTLSPAAAVAVMPSISSSSDFSVLLSSPCEALTSTSSVSLGNAVCDSVLSSWPYSSFLDSTGRESFLDIGGVVPSMSHSMVGSDPPTCDFPEVTGDSLAHVDLSDVFCGSLVDLLPVSLPSVLPHASSEQPPNNASSGDFPVSSVSTLQRDPVDTECVLNSPELESVAVLFSGPTPLLITEEDSHLFTPSSTNLALSDYSGMRFEQVDDSRGELNYSGLAERSSMSEINGSKQGNELKPLQLPLSEPLLPQFDSPMPLEYVQPSEASTLELHVGLSHGSQYSPDIRGAKSAADLVALHLGLTGYIRPPSDITKCTPNPIQTIPVSKHVSLEEINLSKYANITQQEFDDSPVAVNYEWQPIMEVADLPKVESISTIRVALSDTDTVHGIELHETGSQPSVIEGSSCLSSSFWPRDEYVEVEESPSVSFEHSIMGGNSTVTCESPVHSDDLNMTVFNECNVLHHVTNAAVLNDHEQPEYFAQDDVTPRVITEFEGNDEADVSISHQNQEFTKWESEHTSSTLVATEHRPGTSNEIAQSVVWHINKKPDVDEDNDDDFQQLAAAASASLAAEFAENDDDDEDDCMEEYNVHSYKERDHPGTKPTDQGLIVKKIGSQSVTNQLVSSALDRSMKMLTRLQTYGFRGIQSECSQANTADSMYSLEKVLKEPDSVYISTEGDIEEPYTVVPSSSEILETDSACAAEKEAEDSLEDELDSDVDEVIDFDCDSLEGVGSQLNSDIETMDDVVIVVRDMESARSGLSPIIEVFGTEQNSSTEASPESNSSLQLLNLDSEHEIEPSSSGEHLVSCSRASVNENASKKQFRSSEAGVWCNAAIGQELLPASTPKQHSASCTDVRHPTVVCDEITTTTELSKISRSTLIYQDPSSRSTTSEAQRGRLSSGQRRATRHRFPCDPSQDSTQGDCKASFDSRTTLASIESDLDMIDVSRSTSDRPTPESGDTHTSTTDEKHQEHVNQTLPSASSFPALSKSGNKNSEGPYGLRIKRKGPRALQSKDDCEPTLDPKNVIDDISASHQEFGELRGTTSKRFKSFSQDNDIKQTGSTTSSSLSEFERLEKEVATSTSTSTGSVPHGSGPDISSHTSSLSEFLRNECECAGSSENILLSLDRESSEMNRTSISVTGVEDHLTGSTKVCGPITTIFEDVLAEQLTSSLTQSTDSATATSITCPLVDKSPLAQVQKFVPDECQHPAEHVELTPDIGNTGSDGLYSSVPVDHTVESDEAEYGSDTAYLETEDNLEMAEVDSLTHSSMYDSLIPSTYEGSLHGEQAIIGSHDWVASRIQGAQEFLRSHYERDCDSLESSEHGHFCGISDSLYTTSSSVSSGHMGTGDHEQSEEPEEENIEFVPQQLYSLNWRRMEASGRLTTLEKDATQCITEVPLETSRQYLREKLVEPSTLVSTDPTPISYPVFTQSEIMTDSLEDSGAPDSELYDEPSVLSHPSLSFEQVGSGVISSGSIGDKKLKTEHKNSPCCFQMLGAPDISLGSYPYGTFESDEPICSRSSSVAGEEVGFVFRTDVIGAFSRAEQSHEPLGLSSLQLPSPNSETPGNPEEKFRATLCSTRRKILTVSSLPQEQEPSYIISPSETTKQIRSPNSKYAKQATPVSAHPAEDSSMEG
ncbi:hypothetical protein PHET_00880, partial [Paragonimus heterotremus]